MKRLLPRILGPCIFVLAGNAGVSGPDGVFVRFKVIEPPQLTFRTRGR
jgi:hypothetical protein